ncbi:histidine kinase [Streptomyces longwoodensis]|uniref:histidine kinase n=1 Tax=Streptomyces longwoodensis TaxID=68231 RepID=UPI003700D5BC
MSEKIAGVAVPDSALARAATELVRETTPPLIFHHSRRVYLFGSLQAQALGLAPDPELLYVAALFHDTGLVPPYRSDDQRFEMDGADQARAFLLDHRIAQELHDEVGQTMTAILLGLKRAADEAPEGLRHQLCEVQEITRESLDEVRHLVRRLRPGVLDDLGLVSALTSLTEDFATHTGLRVVRRFATDLPALAPETELVLYRVAQESLTNAARHADAERITVDLRHDDDSVVLTVVDDGCGITVPREGAGIRGMRERALLAGGRLEISAAPRTGTQVQLTAPAPGRQP